MLGEGPHSLQDGGSLGAQRSTCVVQMPIKIVTIKAILCIATGCTCVYTTTQFCGLTTGSSF